LLAMDVNDNAGHLMPRGVLATILGTPPGASSLLQNGNGASPLATSQL